MTGIRLVSLLFAALGLVLLILAPPGIPGDSLGDPGPAMLPRMVGGLTLLLALVLFLKPASLPMQTGNNPRSQVFIVWSLLAIPLFYLVFAWLGYTIASALYLFLAASLLGTRRPVMLVRYALAAAVFSLASGLIFARLLEMPLPGVWP